LDKAIIPQKILLIRTDRIGDVILTLPMVDVLHTNFPEAKIDFLVNKRTAELVSNYSNINKVHAIEKESIGEIKRICRENEYDLAIIVHPMFKLALGIYLGGIKYRLGTRNRWYSFLFNIRHSQHRKHSLKHEMQYNLDLLDELNCYKINEIRPILKVEDRYISKVRKLLDSKGIKGEFIVIHIPSLGSAMVWSDENFVKLIDLITEKNGINIILTGTKDDMPHLDNILNRVSNNKNIFTFTELSLNDLAALIKLSMLFIGNSTGPIHIGAAVGTFVVGFYSPVKVQSPVRWGPITVKKKVFVPETDNDSRNVMDDIKPEDVWAYVRDYLKLK